MRTMDFDILIKIIQVVRDSSVFRTICKTTQCYIFLKFHFRFGFFFFFSPCLIVFDYVEDLLI